jgi:hypothetical protein
MSLMYFNHRKSSKHGLKLSDVPKLVEHIASKELDPLASSHLLIAGIENAFDVPTEPSRIHEEPYESGALSCAIATVNDLYADDDGFWLKSHEINAFIEARDRETRFMKEHDGMSSAEYFWESGYKDAEDEAMREREWEKTREN